MRIAGATLSLLLIGALPGSSPLAAQEHQHGHAAHGRVDFEVSCSPEAQQAFEYAVASLHSFEYGAARRAFAEIAKRDPSCGMAQWGVAMTWYHPLWAPPTPDEFTAGRAAARQAAKIGARTERERSFIAAINAYYDGDDRDHRTRALAYREAVEQTARLSPNDDEAAIFHALAILGAAPPSDPAQAEQRQAAEILNRLLPRQPEHPGIAHYTIHAFDHPQLAELALPAARVYASIAPESPHALHMPTHIFTRLGLWDESISANHACRRTDEARLARLYPGRSSPELLHCGDYMVYAYLQQGEDEKARRMVEQISASQRFDDGNFAVGYALLAVSARYTLERRDWQAAAALKRPDAELEWSQFAYAEGITHFANAIGAARSGALERARQAVSQLERLHARLANQPPAGPYDWAGHVESTRLAAAGWIAFADGQPEDAVRLLTEAAQLEETVGKHPVTPGAILPAYELLGELLLELNRPNEALDAFERALQSSPRRFNGLLGAARAARAAGERDVAAEHYAALVEVAGRSATRQNEIREANAFLAAIERELARDRQAGPRESAALRTATLQP